MGQILIRNLDDAVIADLKKRAVAHSTSAEEEARRTLTASVRVDRDAMMALADAIAASNGPQSGETSVEILAAYRYPDGAH